VVDLDVQRIAAWNSAHLPIHEVGLPKVVRIARDGANETVAILPSLGKTVELPARQPNLIFSTRVADCVSRAEIILICVNTPTKTYGIGAGFTADLSSLAGATEMVAKHMKDGAIVVEKSTVPTGTAKMIKEIVRDL
jgi:UDPglucose 6-dehydrogenase